MAGLHFDITGDNTNLMNKLRQTENGIRQTSRSIEQSGLGIEEMFSRISKAAAGIGVAFSAQQFASQVMKVRGEFQQLEVAFETMLGSAEKANALMAQITRTAAVTPFGLQDVAGGAKQLLAYGVASEEVNDTLVRLGDIAAGLSIPLNDLVYLYGTTMTQGRMFTQDLRQFQGRGIPLADELAKQFGVTKDKVGELVTAGRVGFEEMRKAIVSMTSEGGKFGGLMEAQSKTITGQISNIEDAIDGMFNKIGQSSEGVINTALSGVSSLVENYEKVGGVLAALVGIYGAYRAAIIAASAVEAVKVFGLKTGLHYTLLNTKALGALTIAQKTYNATLSLSPWGMAAAGVAALAIGAYKLFTYQTDLEKSTQKLNKEISKEQNNIDDLFGKLDAAKEGTEDYETAKQEIINQYGSYLNGLRDEVATLKDVEAAYLAVSSAAKLSAQERAIADANEKANKDYNSQKEGIFNEISSLFLDNKRASSSVLAAIQKDFAQLGDGNISKQTEEEIKKYKEVGDQILRQISFIKAYRLERDRTFQGNRKNFDEWGVLSMSESELSKRIESVKALRKQMESSGKEGNLVTSSGKMVFNSLLEIDSYLSALEARSAKITEGRKDEKAEDGDTYTEAYKKAEKRWKEATKAVEDAKKKSQKEYEAAVQELDYAESEFKKLGGDTTGKGKKKSDKEVEEAEKRAEELLSIRRQNQQDEINLMKDGSEKKTAQIELDFQKEMDAINAQRDEWKKTQDGELSNEQTIALSDAEANAIKSREKELAELRKENLESELQSLYDYLQEYGTIQQQKYAIAKAYDMKIAEERDANRKKSLQKEKENAMASADASSLAMGIDWGATFEGVGNILKDIATETLQKVEDYMKTVEFKGLSAESKQSYADLRNRLREETGDGATSPFNFKQWGVIANQVKDYQRSVQNLKEAQNQHSIAVRNLVAAEEELASATDGTAKELAQQKVDLANAQVDTTANNQNKAEQDTENAKNNLTNSTNQAAQGIRQFTAALNEMSSGSLYGFANGVTKLIGNLLGDDSSLSKGLEGLGGKIGGIVGAILQILEALGDNPQQFIDNLLKSVADAVSNLLADLPKIVVTILERVVDIVGGVLGGIASWFGIDNVGESDKNLQKDIERLTASNENLRTAIDNLSDKMEKSSVAEATDIYEQQVSNLQKTITNTKEMMLRSAEAYSNGFLGVGGNHSSAYYVDQGMSSREWNRISSIVGKTVRNASDFFNLTSEQMALVATEATDLYSKIESLADDGHKDAAQYMDEYIQYYKELEELENGWREKLTSSSFDSIRNDFKSVLMDMESDTEDFAKSFEELMKNAVIESLMSSKYDRLLQDWYKNFANYMEDGNLGEAEKGNLKTWWDDIVKQGIADRDALKEMGIISDDSSYSQEASGKGFQAMSQETGEELNGRFTALQISNEEIKNQMVQAVLMLSQATAVSSQGNAILNDILQQQALANIHLADIVKYTKPLQELTVKMDALIENTKNL